MRRTLFLKPGHLSGLAPLRPGTSINTAGRRFFYVHFPERTLEHLDITFSHMYQLVNYGGRMQING